MFTKIGKLLVSNIKNSVLYEFAVGLIGLISDLVDSNGSTGEYITAVQEAVYNFKAAFSKNSKNPFTVVIKEKHKERFFLYIALKRQINTALKLITNPTMVAGAANLKREMKECGLWTNKSLSYRDATKTIHQIVQKFAMEPFTQWVTDASLQTIVASLGTAQGEYETLKQDRFEEMGSDMTPIESDARNNLIEDVLSTLAMIDFGSRRNNEAFVDPAQEISEMITETNALTRASETRASNSDDVEDEVSDTEAEGPIETEPEVEEDVLSGAPAHEYE